MSNLNKKSIATLAMLSDIVSKTIMKINNVSLSSGMVSNIVDTSCKSLSKKAQV